MSILTAVDDTDGSKESGVVFAGCHPYSPVCSMNLFDVMKDNTSGVESMLGNTIGHARGRVVGTRVLPPVENEVNVEISFQGSGEILGVPMSDMGTSRLIFRQDGMIEASDGHIVMFGPKGEIARLKSAGLGRLTGAVPQGRYTSTGMFETTAACWKHLNEIIGIFEFIVDDRGEYTVRIWEWK